MKNLGDVMVVVFGIGCIIAICWAAYFNLTKTK